MKRFSVLVCLLVLAVAASAAGQGKSKKPITIEVTVAVDPVGLSFTVDGVMYTAPQVFSWKAGSSHTLTTAATQASSFGYFVFTGWNDGGAVTHNVAPQLAIAYTAAFVQAEEPPPPPPPPAPAGKGIWISQSEVEALPMAGPAWDALLAAANLACGTPDLENQDSQVNTCVLAKALVYARTGSLPYYTDVVSAITSLVQSGTYSGRALALGREIGTYAVAADIVDLKAADPSLDAAFRLKLMELRTTPTRSGPTTLVECHERRPNNWGTHCGASLAAIAAYLGDTDALARVAQVFKGYLGDRAAYAGFVYGTDLSWQADPSLPVGINPVGATIDGYNVDGVLPDDQRRGGRFSWPPPHENYVYEGLQGALAQALLLHRAGYDVFNWENQALKRAFVWVNEVVGFPAEGDDTWQPYVVNFFYGTSFSTVVPSRSGKAYGFTDWTLQR